MRLPPADERSRLWPVGLGRPRWRGADPDRTRGVFLGRCRHVGRLFFGLQVF